jgi:hypothetical protein
VQCRAVQCGSATVAAAAVSYGGGAVQHCSAVVLRRRRGGGVLRRGGAAVQQLYGAAAVQLHMCPLQSVMLGHTLKVACGRLFPLFSVKIHGHPWSTHLYSENKSCAERYQFSG